ncbi:MAG: ATP-binding cassette domain-containing protein [Eubacteriales bacterium]|nr:ATP-binding cassette domain-containing protein [Eubacteriales bacterium]
MSKEVLMHVEDVKKYYPLKSTRLLGMTSYLKAVDGVTLDIYKGEVLGIVGESGCGKSTLGQMLTFLIEPTGGEVKYLPGGVPRRDVQIIFQDPYSSLNPKKKIGWLIEEPLTIHRIGTREERKKKAREIIEIVGLDASYLDKYPNELSGGQRQRVSIAIALILNPRFVVADESVSALDVSIQAQILNLLKNLQKTRNLTYVFISHDLHVVHYISDRIGVMYLGKLVEVGDVEAVYNEPMHPYTQALLSAIPSVEGEEKERVILQGDVPSPIDTKPGCAFYSRCPWRMEICEGITPNLVELDNGRHVRCHRYLCK